jgi:2-amino-4-hydroxy-6-hydroxymethyldihydropteridine diphosphokinase
MVLRVTVYIGLGSNIGRRRQNIVRALSCLAADTSYRVTAVSSLYATSPVGPAQRQFVNAVVRATTDRTPDEVLADLKAIERKMGRKRTRRWGPRVIDLDILLYGTALVNTPRLHIPHPCMHERRFVLEPLAELAGRLRHPLLKKTVKKLRDGLRLTGKDQKVTMVGNTTKRRL